MWLTIAVTGRHSKGFCGWGLCTDAVSGVVHDCARAAQCLPASIAGGTTHWLGLATRGSSRGLPISCCCAAYTVQGLWGPLGITGRTLPFSYWGCCD